MKQLYLYLTLIMATLATPVARAGSGSFVGGLVGGIAGSLIGNAIEHSNGSSSQDDEDCDCHGCRKERRRVRQEMRARRHRAQMRTYYRPVVAPVIYTPAPVYGWGFCVPTYSMCVTI